MLPPRSAPPQQPQAATLALPPPATTPALPLPEATPSPSRTAASPLLLSRSPLPLLLVRLPPPPVPLPLAPLSPGQPLPLDPLPPLPLPLAPSAPPLVRLPLAPSPSPFTSGARCLALEGRTEVTYWCCAWYSGVGLCGKGCTTRAVRQGLYGRGWTQGCGVPYWGYTPAARRKISSSRACTALRCSNPPSSTPRRSYLSLLPR